MSDVHPALVEGMARLFCERRNTGQCAAICLSHSSLFTTKGQCPEAPVVFRRDAKMVLALQAAAVAKAIDEFTASILHGDDKHQAWLKDKAAEYIRALRQEEGATKIDPRDPDPAKEGVFRDHNCWRCKDGTLPCVAGNPRQCENLHARND